MTNGNTYKGSCFCGAVQFTVTGEPVTVSLVGVGLLAQSMRLRYGNPMLCILRKVQIILIVITKPRRARANGAELVEAIFLRRIQKWV